MDSNYAVCNKCGKTLLNCNCKKDKHRIQFKTYNINNLDCAACSNKLEDKLNTYPGIKQCTISYPTSKIKIEAADQDKMLPEIVGVCQKMEPDVTISPENNKKVMFNIDGLDCANCAKKIENKLNEDPKIDKATIDYATGTLSIEANDPTSHIGHYQKVIDSVEDGVTLSPKDQKKKDEKKNTYFKELFPIIVGSIIFIAGWLLESRVSHTTELIFQLIAYVFLGGEIVLKAFKNILHGDFFDENFLMTVATVGAFVIGDYHEAVGVMLFYRIGEFFEDYAVDKSREQIINSLDLRDNSVNLIRDGNTVKIPIEDTNVGDTLLVRPGERIPLDGVVIKGDSRIDTSPITGEPVPVRVKKDSEVTSGTINLNTPIELKVTKKLSDSMVTKILDSVENAAANKPKIDRFITKFSKVYTPIVIGLALFIAIVPSLVTGNWYHWVYTAISFLVISCPCALVLSVPLAYFCGIGAASRLGILFKGGISIEAIDNIKSIALDKTGTITEGNFKVQGIYTTGISKQDLLKIASSCESMSTHPIAQSILEDAKAEHLKYPKPENIQEIAGNGIVAKIDGKTYYCGNKKLLETHNIKVKTLNKEIGTKVFIADTQKELGEIVISDTLKKDAKSVINQLKKLGLKTVLLTGDTAENANEIAQKVGIDHVYASLLPTDKLDKLNEARKEHGSIMFVGDGINDAPVIAGANVGAAMGSGSDAAIEAADVVFLRSNLKAILDSIKIGKKTAFIAKENVVIALAVKALILLLGFFGFANMWLAVLADTGVSLICILNSIRLLFIFRKK